jgi:hypothetical protein
MQATASSDTALISTYVTVIVATIAGVFSLLGLVIAKEQKVSEFRQAWIDALRQDVAEFIAQANIIHAALAKLAKQASPDKVKFLNDNRESYLAVNRCSTRIRLRLNVSEAPSKTFLAAMRSLESLMVREIEKWTDEPAELTRLNLEVENTADDVLKAEWVRVKDGEPQYVVAKWLASILAGGCLIMIAFAIVSARRHGLWN